MSSRTMSSIILIIILITVLYVMPIQISVIFMCIVTFFAIRELLMVSQNEFTKKFIIPVAFLGALVPITLYFNMFSMLLFTISVYLIVFLYLKHHESLNFNDISFIILASVVLPRAINTLTSIFLLENGKYLILLPMIAAWGSDIFAYLFGKTIGKHKLAPSISPNKTIEGSIGGIFGGVIGMLIFGYFTNSFIEIPTVSLVIMGAFGALVGQMGDLFFSMIKRQAGIKDYSKIIPGHGGILDRFDSVIFTAPLALAILTLI